MGLIHDESSEWGSDLHRCIMISLLTAVTPIFITVRCRQHDGAETHGDEYTPRHIISS